MGIIFDSIRFKLDCEKCWHSRGNFFADIIRGDYWKVWGGICAYFDQTRHMIVVTQLKGDLNHYVIENTSWFEIFCMTVYLIGFKGLEILENYFRWKGLKYGFININFWDFLMSCFRHVDKFNNCWKTHMARFSKSLQFLLIFDQKYGILIFFWHEKKAILTPKFVFFWK